MGVFRNINPDYASVLYVKSIRILLDLVKSFESQEGQYGHGICEKCIKLFSWKT
jgi:hypothetical protein